MEEEEKSWRDARSGVRTGLGLGFEIAANTGLDIFSFVPGSQQAGSAFINYLAQKIRGGEVSKGEILAAAATSQIPGLTQAKALTRGGRFYRSVAKGGISGGVTTTSMSLVDEKELPSFGEFATGVTGGGLLGGAFDLVPATVTGNLGKEVDDIKFDTSVFLKQLKSRVTGKPIPVNPALSAPTFFGEGTIGAAKPVDPNDVPRNQQGTWMTPGRKKKPLAAKFFDDAGWIGGRLNLKSWRDAPGDGKAIAELFLTAQDKGVVFQTEAAKQNTFMSRVFGIQGAKQLIGAPEDATNIFQAHHMTATKAVLTGQEGLVYDSPYYHEIQKVWEDLELTLGNNPDNIIGTLGLVQRDLDSPHSLIHKFLDSKMGKDGTDFWTPEKMNQIVIYDDAGNAIGHKNFELRKKWTKEQALIFKEAVDLLKLSHEQYYLAKGVRAGEYLTTEPILDEEIVDAFINKLPPKYGTETKVVDGKTVKAYNTSVIEKIAREVAEDPAGGKPTIPSFSFRQLIEEVANKNLRARLDKMYDFAVNQSNGEDMLIEVIFNNMKPIDAIRKYRGNDPAKDFLEKELKEAIRYNRQALKQLYQTKFGEIPPAVTKFDKGADE